MSVTTIVINLEQVAKFAEDAHAGQKRTNGTPYFFHPTRVVRSLQFDAAITDPVTLAAGYLHDVLEDTHKTYGDIYELAGKEVADVVLELTNKHPEGTSFEERTRAMIAKAKGYSDIAKRVKVADRLDNLTDSLSDWEPKRIKRYAVAANELLCAMQPIPVDIKIIENQLWRWVSIIT